MRNATTPFLAASEVNLRRLAIIRVIFIISVAAALLYIYQETQVALLYHVHLGILFVFSVLNVLTFWRLRQPWPVTDLEYFAQLLLDVLTLTAILYFSGGATNPFVSYYLVPLTICAALLPWRYTWIIAGLSLLAYTVMLFTYQPLMEMDTLTGQHDHHMTSDFNMHILGMWFNFALSAVLITYFVVIMANALRQQENALADNREEELRDEQILAVATLAAGTAHELGTPLSTMTVLIDELEQEYQQEKALNSDLQLLKQQISSCRKILQSLVSTAEAHSHGQKSATAVKDYIQQIITRWQVLRPDASVVIEPHSGDTNACLLVDTTLEQAIINLLNNAADACEHNITINCQCQEHEAVINIRDHGPGIAKALADNIGKPFISTKGKGLGLGLFLTHATVKRFGGNIELHNHPQGGTVAQITLPLAG